jgi:hypothetical protein
VHTLIFTTVYSRHMFGHLSFSQTPEAFIGSCAVPERARRILVPAAWKTASNEAMEVDSRRNFELTMGLGDLS